jgi:hypothetical protein
MLHRLQRIIDNGQVVVDLNPVFNPLNEWGKVFFIKGMVEQLDSDGREALKKWTFTDCTEGQCQNCLFNKSQKWIDSMGFKDIYSLCDLLSSLMSHQKLVKRTKVDPIEVQWENFVNEYEAEQVAA